MTLRLSPFARTHELDGGPTVRLRLARPADAPAVAALLAARGVAATDLDVRRLLAYDPARRHVLCAFAPLEGADSLVGIGGIDLVAGAEVDTLVLHERLVDPLGRLLGLVLEARADAHARRVA